MFIVKFLLLINTLMHKEIKGININSVKSNFEFTKDQLIV